MPANDPRYTTPEWKALRRFILDRDGGRCQVQGPKCTTFATAVDHIVAIAEGGDFWQPSNLRATCRRCNSVRGAELANRRAARYRNTEARYSTRQSRW